MLLYGKCECFVMQMCVLCASCGSSQYCVLHDLPFVNAGRGCKRRPYGRGILQSWSDNCLVGGHECLHLGPDCLCILQGLVSSCLSGFSMRLFCFVQAKTFCMYGCIYLLAAFVLVCVVVMVMSSAYVMT